MSLTQMFLTSPGPFGSSCRDWTWQYSCRGIFWCCSVSVGKKTHWFTGDKKRRRRIQNGVRGRVYVCVCLQHGCKPLMRLFLMPECNISGLPNMKGCWFSEAENTHRYLSLQTPLWHYIKLKLPTSPEKIWHLTHYVCLLVIKRICQWAARSHCDVLNAVNVDLSGLSHWSLNRKDMRHRSWPADLWPSC